MLFVVSAWRKSDISVLVISSPFWEIMQRWFLRISLKVLSHTSLVGFINRKACSALSVKIIQRRQCNPDEIPTLSQTVSFSCCEIIFKYDDYFNSFKQWNALIVQLTMKKDFMPNLECYYAVGVWIDFNYSLTMIHSFLLFIDSTCQWTLYRNKPSSYIICNKLYQCYQTCAFLSLFCNRSEHHKLCYVSRS